MTRRVSLAVLVVVLLGALLGYEALSAKGRPETVTLAAEAPPPSTTSSSTTSSPETVTTTTAVPRPVTTHARRTRPPVAPPAPAKGDWAALINQYPWDTAKAYKIMMCESGGNPNAVNRSSGATGLMQIHPGGSKYLDPATNMAAAYAKYKAAGGWSPWVCRA